MGASTSAEPRDLFEDIIQLSACRQSQTPCSTKELSDLHNNIISRFREVPEMKNCLHYNVLSETDRGTDCHKKLAEYFEINNKNAFEASCFGAISELKRKKGFNLIVEQDSKKVDVTPQICEGIYNFMIPRETRQEEEVTTTISS